MYKLVNGILLFFQGWYFYLTMARWFGIRLDLLSNILLVSVVAFSVPIVAHTSKIAVGDSEYINNLLVILILALCRLTTGS